MLTIDQAVIPVLVIVFAVIIRLMERILIHCFGARLVLATGWLGTPVHEISHAVCHFLFGHKIVSIKLFSPDLSTGTLGCVNYTYSPANAFHQVGRFVSGVAPLFGGIAVIYALGVWLLSEKVHVEIASTIDSLLAQHSYLSVEFLLSIAKSTAQLLVTLLSNLAVDVVLYMLLGGAVALHMVPSGTDIKGSVLGALYLLTPLIVFSLLFPERGRYVIVEINHFLLEILIYLVPCLAVACLVTAVSVLSYLSHRLLLMRTRS